MTYSKKNSANNAACWVEFAFNETALIIFATWNYDRFPTTNFLIEVATFNSAWKVTARENMFCVTRTWNQFNMSVIWNRAVEPVPIDDNQTSNIQQALPFEATNTVIKQVVSKKLIDEIQDEIIIQWWINTTTWWSNNYLISVLNINAYYDWLAIKVKSDFTNTGASTLNINSLGVKSIKKNQWTNELTWWEWEIDWNTVLIYNSVLDVFQYEWSIALPTVIWNTKSTVIISENITAWETIVYQKEITWYALSSAVYASKSKAVWTEDTSPYWVFLKPDWTKMYVIWIANDTIYQYTLSTAYDVSTASYDSKSFSVTSQEWLPTWLFFSTDWTKAYTVWEWSDSVFQYTLSTAWDISTASYSSKSFSVSWQDSQPYWVFFKSDWLKMYVAWRSWDNVFQYTLSTAWDVSTASYDSKSLSTSSEEISLQSVYISDDWLQLFAIWSTNKTVFQYNLTTAFDVSTWSYSWISFLVSSEDSAPNSLTFSNGWLKMYVSWNTNNTIYEYDLPKTVSAWYYKWDASDSDLLNFLWFADDTITSWNVVPINSAWVDDNQSWLTKWEIYYMWDVTWTISSSPWTNNVTCWKALSTTEILINSWAF